MNKNTPMACAKSPKAYAFPIPANEFWDYKNNPYFNVFYIPDDGCLYLFDQKELKGAARRWHSLVGLMHL
jgi:hypothetical protein